MSVDVVSLLAALDKVGNRLRAGGVLASTFPEELEKAANNANEAIDILDSFWARSPDILLAAVITLSEWLPHDGTICEKGNVRLVLGDLEQDCVSAASCYLAVLGDIVAEGLVEASGDSPIGNLAVAGSVRAGSVKNDGYFLVGNKLQAQFIEGSYNDGLIWALGELQADLLIADSEHPVNAASWNVKNRYDDGLLEKDNEENFASLKNLLTNDCFDSEYGYDGPFIHKTVSRKRAFLR